MGQQNKSGWREYEIDKWEKFEDLIRSLSLNMYIASGATPFYYRGQPNVKWLLEPTILRTLKRWKRSISEAIFVENALRRDFERQAHLFLSTYVLSHTKYSIQWWSLMRHYGAPTRTLDWTVSPYVGLYFAVNKEPDCDGALWFFNVIELYRRMKIKYDQQRYFPSRDEDDADENNQADKLEKYFQMETADPVVHSYYRGLNTDRMVAQQSTYTACENILVDHTKAIGDVLDQSTCVKATIPKDKKSEYLSRLSVMNITAASLFPGIDGVGQHLTEKADIMACTFRTIAEKPRQV